ncbi:hypothetical protein BJ742DRAFT_194564 [Cladochytrium replicatum]|nr:hypothetical protein BJ742DRAFT_194564 [Cladochytrium replicatum]
MKVEISLHKAETRAWANLGIPKVEQLELAYFTPRESNAVREEFNEALESLCGSGHPLNGDKHDFGTLTDSILPDTMTSSNITIDSQMDELTTLTDENEDDLSEAQLAARATCVFTDNSDDESDLDQERIRSSLVYHSLLPRHTRSLSCNSETNDDGSLYEDGSKDGSSAGTPIRGRLTWLMRRGVGSRSVLSLSEEAGVDTAISTPTSTYSAYDYREFSNVADARIEELRQKFILSRPLSPLFDEAELEIATPNYDDDGNWVDALEGDEDMQRRESRVVPQMITPGVRTDSGYDEPGVITKRPNLTGMANIGNTCFLNCIVQCLNSFDSFVEYFLDQSFANDINLENPLSPSKGKIVRSFAKLLDGLHNGGPSCIRALAGPYVYPKDFLSILAQYAPQYEANQQHDAQEFLQFLLDTVHEEVNKIVKKPYIELPDFDDSADPNFVGSEFWNAHKARNDSIVVDQFQGMYRSKMTCEECGKTSVKCDPYMSLTVDLPELPIEIQFILVTKAMQKLKYQFNMRAESTVNDLYDEIARYLGIPSNCLQAAWLCESLIQVVFIPQTPIATILSRNYQRNFCVFEVEPNSSLFRLSHWKRRERSRSHYRPSYYGEGYSSSDDYETLGFPFFVSILEGTTESSVYPIILERLVEGSLIRSPVDTPLPDQLFSIEIREAGEELPDPRIDEKYSMFSQTGSVIVQWDNEEYWDDFFNEPFDLKVQGLTAERQGIGYRVSLEDCLRQHLQEEASVEWYCPRCKKHTNGSKKLDLWSIPSGGLIIHLKRFVQYGQTPYWVKTDGKVIFPIAPGALDMSDFVVSAGSAEKFELVGVANHWGGLTSGHYTALSKRGGQWYYFDDEKVERAGEDYLEACAGAAYVLFYKPCV